MTTLCFTWHALSFTYYTDKIKPFLSHPNNCCQSCRYRVWYIHPSLWQESGSVSFGNYTSIIPLLTTLTRQKHFPVTHTTVVNPVDMWSVSIIDKNLVLFLLLLSKTQANVSSPATQFICPLSHSSKTQEWYFYFWKLIVLLFQLYLLSLVAIHMFTFTFIQDLGMIFLFLETHNLTVSTLFIAFSRRYSPLTCSNWRGNNTFLFL